MVARVLAVRPGLTVIEHDGVVVWASPGATVQAGAPWVASADDDGAYGMALQADGGIVLTGELHGGDDDLAVLRVVP